MRYINQHQLGVFTPTQENCLWSSADSDSPLHPTTITPPYWLNLPDVSHSLSHWRTDSLPTSYWLRTVLSSLTSLVQKVPDFHHGQSEFHAKYPPTFPYLVYEGRHFFANCQNNNERSCLKLSLLKRCRSNKLTIFIEFYYVHFVFIESLNYQFITLSMTLSRSHSLHHLR